MSNIREITDLISLLSQPNNECSSWKLSKKLFNISRSVSGSGNLETLKIIQKFIGSNFNIKGFSKSEYFSWTKPSYWEFNRASISTIDGKEILSTDKNLLHILIHSIPFNGEINREDLAKHLYTDDNKKLIPYRTSYYKKNWGFCVTQKQYDQIMKHKKLIVSIDCNHSDKPVPYGECLIKGNVKDEILLTSYICHPSMANNELSGILLLLRVIKSLEILAEKQLLPYSVRLLLAPETFGSIAYISENHKQLLKRTKGVIVCSCVGDGRKISIVKGRKPKNFYKCFKLCAESVAYENQLPFQEYSFLERGADERQFASPHVSLDVGTLCNTKFSEYPEYHTSADNLDIISEKSLAISSEVILRTLVLFANNINPEVKDPCEPMFSKLGIYPHTRNYETTKKNVMDLLNFSAYSDGSNTLQEIAEICQMSDKEALNHLNIFSENGVIK